MSENETSGFIFIHAEGGLNQQRIAVRMCLSQFFPLSSRLVKSKFLTYFAIRLKMENVDLTKLFYFIFFLYRCFVLNTRVSEDHHSIARIFFFFMLS